MKIYEAPEDFKDFQPALTAMCIYGIEELYASWDGGGDCGEIDDASILPAVFENEEVQPKVKIEQTRYVYENVGGEYRHNQITEELELPIIKAYEQLVYNWLESQGTDWYNNNGGHGEMVFTVKDGKASVKCESYVRIMETETEYSNEINLEEY